MIGLNDSLNELWSNVVEEIDFKHLEHKIKFKLKAVYDDKTIYNEIVFEDVSAYYYLESSGLERHELIDYEKGDYIEFTSIGYYENGIGRICIKSDSEQWTKQYFSSANFAIELWNSILFIEAKKVIVNDQQFTVGFPKL